MAINIPTTQELIDGFITNFQNRLNQTIPALAKSFVRVTSVNMGVSFTSLYKYGAERALQNLALTATDEDLDRIGQNYNVFRTPAVSAVLDIDVFVGSGRTLGANTDFVADTNRQRYRTTDTTIGTGATETVEVSAVIAGADGNLQVADTLVIGTTLVEIGPNATVTAVVTVGADRETDEDYRRRVLNEIRTVGGGGNAVDYRTWAEEVAGVSRAYPYSGAPLTALRALRDGNMEDAGLTYWFGGHGASYGKDTTVPVSGLRSMKIERGSQDNPYVYQSDIFTIGQRYIIRGWARGDNIFAPSVQDPLGTDIWLGDIAFSWREFEFEHTAQNTDLFLVGNQTSTGAVWFDDLEIHQVSLPGDRTIYVEADTSIDPDGIPPQALLDEVRDTINNDPATGRARPPLGETDQTLFVEPISRTSFFVDIESLDVSPDQEAAAKADILADLTTFFLEALPFVVGIDFESDRTDLITNLTVSTTVQNILSIYGGSASAIRFGLFSGDDLKFYQLRQGELAKLGGVEYV
jgi:hypothetical protein